MEQSWQLCRGKAPQAARGRRSFPKVLVKGLGEVSQHLGCVTEVLLGAGGTGSGDTELRLCTDQSQQGLGGKGPKDHLIPAPAWAGTPSTRLQ